MRTQNMVVLWADITFEQKQTKTKTQYTLSFVQVGFLVPPSPVSQCVQYASSLRVCQVFWSYFMHIVLAKHYFVPVQSQAEEVLPLDHFACCFGRHWPYHRHLSVTKSVAACISMRQQDWDLGSSRSCFLLSHPFSFCPLSFLFYDFVGVFVSLFYFSFERL